MALSLGGGGHDLTLNSMSLVMSDKYLFMGAMNNGFSTGLQSMDAADGEIYDTFVHRFDLPAGFLDV